MSDINKILLGMRKAGKIQDWKAKGTAGEEAALAVVLDRYKRTGGLVYHSFKYPYQSNREGTTYTGNIKYEDGQYVEYTDSSLDDEIDILYISPYRVFPIEVKAYHAKIEVTDEWVKKQGTLVDKSPVAQCEKHARHLYHAISDVLPDGRPEYIKPITCFVDRCTLVDKRSASQISYIPCCILNSLKATIVESNIPLRYNLDIEAIKQKLNEVKTSVEKEFI